MIFLDSSFIISYKLDKDENHLKALKIMGEIISKKYGKPLVSDYVFDEVVTVIFNKTKNHSNAAESGEELINSYVFIKINDLIFDDAWKIFKEQRNTKLSFTDCTIIATMKSEGIKNIATFDEDFKEVEDINVID